ncbi:hypothetical protein [Methanosarcina lacustris]|uniref:hypothetical protein n=1 Tax=Methanosarcina lacustris TaxID=170861 RepID=UPI00064F8D87|nr:hypothetical protein [Methanosarcina lacustris]
MNTNIETSLKIEITVPGYEYQKICDVSQSTANRDIQDMLDKKLLKQNGKIGQQVIYVLNF